MRYLTTHEKNQNITVTAYCYDYERRKSQKGNDMVDLMFMTEHAELFSVYAMPKGNNKKAFESPDLFIDTLRNVRFKGGFGELI